MFTKYLGKFGKAEAEWALEVLDMHGGDEQAARNALVAALDRLIAHRQAGEKVAADFDRYVDACCFAAGDWWNTGLQRLRELGKIPTQEGPPKAASWPAGE